MRPIVIKYGGSLLEEPGHRARFLNDIASVCNKEKIVLVHGGGKEISKALEASGLPVKFVHGLRYTDEATMQIVDRVLSTINREIVSHLQEKGVQAAGFSGKTQQFVIGRQISELGRVGQPQMVNQDVLEALIDKTTLPVFYSVAVDSQGDMLNMNADDFALALAVASTARRLIYLTDSGGINDAEGRPVGMISAPDVKSLIEKGVITGGMIVKSQACVEALRRGVGRVDICRGINFLKDPQSEMDGTSFVQDASRNN